MHTTGQAKFCLHCNNFLTFLLQFNKHFHDVRFVAPVFRCQNLREHKFNNFAFNGTVQSFFLDSKDHFELPTNHGRSETGSERNCYLRRPYRVS